MKKKKIKIAKKKLDYTADILKILSKDPEKSLNYKQIAAKLELKDSKCKNQIIKDLKILKKQNKLEEIQVGKYKIQPQSDNYLEGIIDMTTRKNAYFVSEMLQDDVFIPFSGLNHALDGDRVKVYIYNRRRNKKVEAEVVEILERKKTAFVGIFQDQKKFGFVLCNNPKMYTDIFVPADKFNGANNGDVVLVEIEDWPSIADSPFGKIIKTIGKPGEHDTEIHAILTEYGLPYSFPSEVQEYADQLDTSISEDEIAKRRDMRGVLTFTIDPKDAKDFDDALSFQILENGNYQIGVHIADVSHYVQEGSVLDDEAYNRATSIYLVDRVVPMLPEVLSNFACSLRPLEEKYAFSAVFELNQKAEIIDKWFGKTVIYSDSRFSYEEAQHIIETNSSTIPSEVSLTGSEYEIEQNIKTAILTLDDLAKKIRKKRMQQGAISFDKVEVKFNLNENAEPIGVYFKEQKDANHLIEEFMLLANRKVAEFIGKQHKTFIYRIHDEPDLEKLLNLQQVISRFGYSINLKSKKEITQSLNNLLEDVSGTKEQNLIDMLAIRSMSKAKYSTTNIGHYGLAFDYYTHFTSPIRRYPDVITHRLLQHYLEGGKTVNTDLYEAKCLHCSSQEGLATNAERDSIKYMQVKYMNEHKDTAFIGVVSGVTEWGIFVEIIENKCEGLVRIRDIKDDYYTFDEKQYALIGASSKNTIQLGDIVKVKVKMADLNKKQLDFELVE
ncbi:MAG: ribonuclease R [Bacteroidota bacterium]|nr:ribonuclease R [Bacteroidota bacterium]